MRPNLKLTIAAGLTLLGVFPLTPADAQSGRVAIPGADAEKHLIVFNGNDLPPTFVDDYSLGTISKDADSGAYRATAGLTTSGTPFVSASLDLNQIPGFYFAGSVSSITYSWLIEAPDILAADLFEGTRVTASGSYSVISNGGVNLYSQPGLSHVYDGLSPVFSAGCVNDLGCSSDVYSVGLSYSRVSLDDFAGTIILTAGLFGGPNIPLGSGSAYLDPVVSIDPTFAAAHPGFKVTSAIISPTVVGAAAVPEPATWSMMILGFGVAGSAVRRRRSRTLARA